MTILRRPHIVDAPVMHIPRMGLWLCCSLICLYKLPIRWICITATRSLFNDHTWKTTHRWHSVDTHSQNRAVTVLLSNLPLKADNLSVMHNGHQITVQWPYLHDHKSLTLHWCSFSEWGGDHIAVCFAYKSSQYVGYPQQQPDYCSITALTRPQIVDAALKLIYCIVHSTSVAMHDCFHHDLNSLFVFLSDWDSALWQSWAQ